MEKEYLKKYNFQNSLFLYVFLAEEMGLNSGSEYIRKTII